MSHNTRRYWHSVSTKQTKKKFYNNTSFDKLPITPENLEKLQIKVTKVLGKDYHNVERKNDIFWLKHENFNNNQENIKRYYEFLLFCLKKINLFKIGPDQTQNKMLYTVDNLTESDKKKIDNSRASYNNYNNSQEVPSINQILEKNEVLIDTKTRNKYFDEMSSEQLLDILKERIKQLEICSKKKTQRTYYNEEFVRENDLINKKDEKDLGVISDSIIWNERIFNSLKLLDDEKFERLYNYWTTGEDKNQKIKRLMTFLPLEFFIIAKTNNNVNDNDNIRIDKEKFKQFLMTNGKINKQNFQQIVLGFDLDIKQDYSHNLPSAYDTSNVNNDLLFLNYSMIMDIKKKTNCYLCDYSIYLNLLLLFMNSLSRSKTFPIIFKLPQYEYSYNQASDSYSFRTSKQYSPNNLFDNNRKFIGMHLIRYFVNVNGKRFLKILPIFIFNNLEYELETSSHMYSIYSGVELETVHTDFFLSRIEDGEIKGRLSITHQELYDLSKYYKLIPYIMNNNNKELFFTKKHHSDENLKKLIELLNMKPVKIVKSKLLQNKPARFKIVPYNNESEIDYQNGAFYEIMKTQTKEQEAVLETFPESEPVDEPVLAAAESEQKTMENQNQSKKFSHQKSSMEINHIGKLHSNKNIPNNTSPFTPRKYSKPGTFKGPSRERKGGSKCKTRKNKKSKKSKKTKHRK